jgi:hypothetical protein
LRTCLRLRQAAIQALSLQSLFEARKRGASLSASLDQRIDTLTSCIHNMADDTARHPDREKHQRQFEQIEVIEHHTLIS